ncbi:o-succinylbenzoate--CoA ligase [Vibrio methylphosphonaticus]|uniref:o-succinylbenzoate--CoA ligase n=1 Tax=Vibrio methylphosphonaticus TaxID=2946866 RepID=UPI00202AB61F|nr:o-succinylbenzoate--CoA ligase [Vibrio methylphosphonaticus]MCL9776125.1 o-succinylbenzoate--CoA ligase [Vibrio methylphosphonaticus]
MNLWTTWAQHKPNDAAVVTTDRTYTWQQIQKTVQQYQQALIDEGVQSHSVVCLVGRAEIDLVFAYLACVAQGAIPAMVSASSDINDRLETLYKANEKAYLWDCSGTGIDFTAQTRTREIGIICLDFPEDKSHNKKMTSLEEKNSADLHQCASIIFTSGSTGKPKAVVHTVEQHLASAKGLLERFSYSDSDRWLLSLPMFHVSGLAIIWRWLSAGAQLKIADGVFSQDIADVSHASLVVTQLKRIIEQRIPNQLRRVLLGGSHIPNELIQQAQASGIAMWMGYGMTETASTVTAKLVDQHSSSGTALPNRQVRLQGQRIQVKGAVLSQGYFYQGHLRSLALTDGWFDTGDLGCWSDNHELMVTGRADNLFISGGENIHCEEVEAVLNRLPNVSQSIIIPVVCDEFGARPVAVIQSVDNSSDDSEMRSCELSSDEKLMINQLLKGSGLEKFKYPIAYFRLPDSLASSGIKVSRAQVKRWLSSAQSDYVVIS